MSERGAGKKEERKDNKQISKAKYQRKRRNRNKKENKIRKQDEEI